jgi:tRNA 2-selenouridine synthase
MIKNSSLSPREFLEASLKYPVVDVRTQAEFKQGHIPGAVNMPLFSEGERAEVGTLYKKQGRDQAVLKGLEFVGPKMAGFARDAAKLSVGGCILVHCWRGGMRSESMAWLFRTAGLNAAVLEGGYKAYRASFREQLQKQNWQLVVVGGPTGSGKTEVLRALGNMGEQVLDLEGLAHHKGSAFGALGQKAQPTTEQFGNDIHQQFLSFNPERLIWVEGESNNIGRVVIPRMLFELLMQAPLVMYELARDLRIERLVKEYGGFDVTLLEQAVLKIQKRLGGLKTKEALKALCEKDFHKVADITLQYYDKGYAKSLDKRNKPVLSLKEEVDDPVSVAEKLIKTYSDVHNRYKRSSLP